MVFPSRSWIFQQVVLQLAAYQGVERAEGLVHEQDFRVHGQGARQSDPLLHASGQFGRKTGFIAAKAYGVDDLLRAPLPLRLGHALDFQPEFHIAHDRAMRQQGEVLEDHPELAPAQFAQGLGRQAGDVLPVDVNPAGIGLVQAVDQAQQGRFAAAGQPHDDEDLPAHDFQGDIEHADRCRVLALHFGLAQTAAQGLHGAIGLATKHFADVFPANPGFRL